MKITIHRGQNQIGGCITEIESRSGTRILIDLGHNLPEGDNRSEDKYDIPENMDDLLKGCSAVLYIPIITAIILDLPLKFIEKVFLNTWVGWP